MSFYDASRLTPRASGLRVSGIGAITDPLLGARLMAYKNGTARRFVALSEPEIDTRLAAGETMYVSRKLDGECTFLVHTPEETLLVSPTGRVVAGSAAAAAARAALNAAKVERTILAGELYVGTDGRERAHDVPRALADGADGDFWKNLRFAAFDLLELTTAGATEDAIAWPYPKRYEQLVSWLGTGAGAAGVAIAEKVTGKSAVQECYSRIVTQEGAEGIVVRGEQPVGYKVKPRQTLDLAVVGYVEGRDDKVGTIREVLVAAVRPGGQFHILGSVGTGYSEEQRRQLLVQLQALHASSEYVETNRHYFAYQMVRPELVIEVRVTDFLQEDSRGKPIQQTVLQLNPAGGSAKEWQIVRKMGAVSLIHPVFERVREDKLANEVDCRISQVNDFLVLDVDTVAAPVELPASTIVRREVYTKVTKGVTAVRKLVVWKTNKEQADPLYPAYALHFTDYSPGRADPLQRDVRVAQTEERIQALAEGLLAENIKKGWVRV